MSAQEIYNANPSDEPVKDLKLRIAMFEKSKVAPTFSSKPNQAKKTNSNAVITSAPPSKAPSKQMPIKQAPSAAPPKITPSLTVQKSVDPATKNVVAKPTNIVRPTSIHRNGELGNRKSQAVQGTSIKQNSSSNSSSSPSSSDKQNPEGRESSSVHKSIFFINDKTKSKEIQLTKKETMLPPKGKNFEKPAPELPERNRQRIELVRVGNRTYRKLPFVAPSQPAPRKPSRPPMPIKLTGKQSLLQLEDDDEMYTDVASFRAENDGGGKGGGGGYGSVAQRGRPPSERNGDFGRGGKYDEDTESLYEVVGAFS